MRVGSMNRRDKETQVQRGAYFHISLPSIPSPEIHHWTNTDQG